MRATTIAVLALALTLGLVGCEKESEHGAWKKEIITAAGAPKAIGPYSQAVKVGPWLFISGQIAIDPATGELITGDFESELRRVLENIGAVLHEAGMDYSDVVQATVFLADLDNYAKLNEVYSEYFTSDFPARCAVQVARLPKDVNVEIAVIAYRGEED